MPVLEAQSSSANLDLPYLTPTNLAYLEHGLSRYRDRVKIDPDSPEHPYVQLAGLLRTRIRSGKIGPRVPSIMELSRDTDLSPATVKRAFGLLREEGLIVTVRGRGTFVAGQAS